MLTQITLTLKMVLRDRILHAVVAVGLLLIVVIPVFSSFSMRQAQESAIGMVLSATSLILLVLAAHLGASSIYRDVERRYTHAVLSLPLTRGQYVVGRFLGISFFLFGVLVFLALCSAIVIVIAASTHPSPLPIAWGTLGAAFFGLGLKYLLLTSVALFFSALSTSFSLPFFCTLAVYLAGSASQEVFDYLTGTYDEKFSWVARGLSQVVYYLCPNFSGFDLQIQAVYGLPVDISQFFVTTAYGVLYIMVMVWGASMVFSRRELP
jgi:ABC-type transport system involved in multi-copper enzyme maturation permease subunit